MRVLVVHESLFGNTRAIAEAISAGVRRSRPDAHVTCVAVPDVGPDAAGADLLVVGGPTHFWGPTSWLTREMQRQYENRIRPAVARRPASRWRERTVGVRTWLATLPPSAGAAAAFDTRIDRPLTGGAAGSIARALRRRGRDLVVPPAGFCVDGVEGPLRVGELARAQAWGATVAALAGAPQARTIAVATATHVAGGETTMSTTTRTAGRPAVDHQVPRPVERALGHGVGDGVGHELERPNRTTPSGARSTLVPPRQAAPPVRRPVDLTRVITTTEIVVGAVLVARELARRPGTSRAKVTMGHGGWVSMRGGTVAVRPARRLWRRARPIPETATAVRRVPLWAHVISAVPLQRLVG